MKVALLYNPRPDGTPATLHSPDDRFEEYDDPVTIEAIAAALRAAGADPHPVIADARLPWRLAEAPYDFAFNIAEGAGRRCREAVPAAVCELLGIPYTGSDPLTLAATLDKSVARRLVSPAAPVANAVLLEDAADEPALFSLQYPVIVKPNDEGSSKGIRGSSLVRDPAQAAAQSRWLQAAYDCPVLAEEFLPGPEVTVALRGPTRSPCILGMMEIAPLGNTAEFIYSLEVKRDYQARVRYHVPPRLPAQTLEEIAALARQSYRLLGCRDIARIDFRLDDAGRPHFLECNPLPGLHPQHSDLVILTRQTMPYSSLVYSILEEAMRRTGVAKS